MTSRISGVVLLLGALVLSSLAAGQETSRQPFTAERSWQIQRIGGPTISPDGKSVVAAVTRYDMKENEGLADLWLWSTDGKETRRLTTHTASESSPLFSPDGKQIAFIAQREKDKAPQLYVIPIAGGEAVRVTNVATGVGAADVVPRRQAPRLPQRASGRTSTRSRSRRSGSRSARTRRSRRRSGTARPFGPGTPGSTTGSSTCTPCPSTAARPRR